MEIIKLSGLWAEVMDEGGEPKNSISILRIGNIKYGEKIIPVTYEFLGKILENFKMNVRKTKVPIEIGHEDSGAYGWVKDLWLEGGFMNMAVEWNEKGLYVLKNKEYAYVSPEIVMNYIDSMDETNTEYGPVLTGVTLTNRPVQKGFTGVIEGFSEKKELDMNKALPKEEKKVEGEFIPGKTEKAKCACKKEIEKMEEETGEPEMIVDEVPDGGMEEEISSIINSLKEVQDKICQHSALKYKKGAPTLRSALKIVNDQLKNFEPKKEEDKKEEQVKMAEQVTTTNEQEKPATEIKAVNLSEFEALKLQLSELSRKFEEEKNEKINLAEAKKLAEDRAKQAEETVLRFAEEANVAEEVSFIKGLIQAGKILPKQENALKALLSETRKQTSTVKLSEGQETLYGSMRAFFSELNPVIDYKQHSTATAQQEVSKDELLLAETKKIQEEKKVDYAIALAEASRKLGYRLGANRE